MTTDRPMCKYQSDCYIPKADMVCVYPALDNVTKLLQVFHGRKPPLLFLGHPLDLHYSGRSGFYLLLENQPLGWKGNHLSYYHMNYKHVLFWTKIFIFGQLQLTKNENYYSCFCHHVALGYNFWKMDFKKRQQIKENVILSFSGFL